jgi:hypothetical protein
MTPPTCPTHGRAAYTFTPTDRLNAARRRTEQKLAGVSSGPDPWELGDLEDWESVCGYSPASRGKRVRPMVGAE